GRSWNWDSSKVTAGDFNGDGKADVAVLYNYDKVDGRNKSALWVFYGTDTGFRDPVKFWESGVPGSIDGWNWNSSELTAGDFNGDGKADIGITYDYGQSADGRNETALWTFTSKGDGFNEPRKVWTNKL
ncbi:VCBS repeat-containing protein, partial [Streptomyces sp. SCA3-4]|uniref:FG-GAP repeat domain-containing protein n=1 Tax=Streptomyces sichuanensis TaxID=2871810 RepID=UPI001CE24234